jgi:hypothetical protein
MKPTKNKDSRDIMFEYAKKLKLWDKKLKPQKKIRWAGLCNTAVAPHLTTKA